MRMGGFFSHFYFSLKMNDHSFEEVSSMIQQLGIDMITIPLPFRLDHVNCFLAEGEKGYIVIDTGLNDKSAQSRWEKELNEKHVQQIILTHLHPDHCGYAGILQTKLDAIVSMSEIDAKALDKIWIDEAIPTLKQDYERSAVPEKLANGILTLTRDFIPSVTPRPKIDTYLQEGELIQIGKEQYEIIFTPGHSAGLVCFYQREKSVLLSTDHILPKITPNIAYWFYGEKNPLLSYEQSLQKIKSLHIDYVIPSHGEPFYDANKRIDEIWQHHEERFAQTIDAIGGGATVFEVCEKLFTKQLNVYDYQFAIGETIAHLEYLRDKGECNREVQNGKWVYK